VQLAVCQAEPALNGKNLAQITQDRGREPTVENAADTAMEILMKGNCQAVYHAIDESDIERIMRYPYTMIGSDGEVAVFGRGVIHPRSYGTFARVLGVYVRERHVITLEDAIRKMSSYPADRMNLMDRGLLRPGMKADVVIFDPDTIADKAEFGNPHQYATGVSYVLVNGQVAIDDGRITDARPGRILYGPAAKMN
jgi:dihydroorotase/N-acyl-D-amino-acid deacylase